MLTPRITRDLVDRYAGEPATPAQEHEDPLVDLTARERDVFAMIAQGLSDAEIASEMFLAEAPVKIHITRIPHKARSSGSRADSQVRVRTPPHVALPVCEADE